MVQVVVSQAAVLSQWDVQVYYYEGLLSSSLKLDVSIETSKVDFLVPLHIMIWHLLTFLFGTHTYWLRWRDLSTSQTGSLVV